MTEVVCPTCTVLMRKEETVTPPKSGPVIEVYQCVTETCQRRAAVIFEPAGGMTEDQRSWVEREIARRGSFFPSDVSQTEGRYGR